MHELIDNVIQVAHNEIGRTVYLIHTDKRTVSVFQPDLDRVEVIQLEHEVERFTHYNATTCLSGLEGATVLLGSEVVMSDLSIGPFSFVEGELKRATTVLDRPDIRGESFRGEYLGTLKLEPYYGTPVAAERYRGFTMAYFQDIPSVFTVWEGQVSPSPEGINIQEKVLGEIYTHSHLRLIKVSVQDGWIFSVDDGKFWRFQEQDGRPIALSDTEVWLVKDKILYNREKVI